MPVSSALSVDIETEANMRPGTPQSPTQALSEVDESEIRHKNSQSEAEINESFSRLERLFPKEDLTFSFTFHDEGLPIYIFDMWQLLVSLCNQFPEVYGAMLTLEDLVSINKQTDAFEIENFFILMEVYGSTPELSNIMSKIFDHQKQREESRKQLDKLCFKLNQTIESLTPL